MSWSDREHNEKRNFIRMRIDAVITFSVEGKAEKYTGRCKNISGAGILIETDKKLDIGTRLEVTVPSESPDIDNLDAIVEVMRVESFPEKHNYMLGTVIKKIKN